MACVLGQLGRHAANDQGEAPRSGGSHRVPLGRRCHFTMLGFSLHGRHNLDEVDGFEAGQARPSWKWRTRNLVPTAGVAACSESSFRAEILMPR